MNVLGKFHSQVNIKPVSELDNIVESKGLNQSNFVFLRYLLSTKNFRKSQRLHNTTFLAERDQQSREIHVDSRYIHQQCDFHDLEHHKL